MNSITLPNIINPDAEIVLQKEPIDIAISTFDITSSAEASVSASGKDYTQLTKLSNDGTAISIIVEDNNSTDVGTIYYTPLYSEKINYQTWQSRVNKNFLELN